MRGRRRQLKQAIPKILDIVNVFGPALNPSLTFHLPASRLTNSKEMMSELQQMRQTAAHYNLGYLSANQVESIYRMFLVHPALAKVTSLNSKVLTKGIYSNPEDYLAFINPETVEGTDAEEMEESCLTFPFMKFYCTRFRTVRVKYRNQLKEFREDWFEGAMGHVVQHCISHLNGQLLLDWQLTKGRFQFQNDMVRHFPKSSFLLKQYSYRLKEYHKKENPSEEEKEQWKKVREEYLDRLKEEYQKETQSFGDNISKGKIRPEYE